MGGANAGRRAHVPPTQQQQQQDKVPSRSRRSHQHQANSMDGHSRVGGSLTSGGRSACAREWRASAADGFGWSKAKSRADQRKCSDRAQEEAQRRTTRTTKPASEGRRGRTNGSTAAPGVSVLHSSLDPRQSSVGVHFSPIPSSQTFDFFLPLNPFQPRNTFFAEMSSEGSGCGLQIRRQRELQSFESTFTANSPFAWGGPGCLPLLRARAGSWPSERKGG